MSRAKCSTYLSSSEHITHAIAVYICIMGQKHDIFTKDVNIEEISQIFAATEEEQRRAYLQAKTILRDFIDRR